MQEFKGLVLKVKGADLEQVIKEIKSLGGDDAKQSSGTNDRVEAEFPLGVDTDRIEATVEEKFPKATFAFSWAKIRHGYL